ncbi:MAG: hypothetical protein ACR2PR_09150 [Pseudohongiellaceae bacterium]
MPLFTTNQKGDSPKGIPAIYRQPVVFHMSVSLADAINETQTSPRFAANDVMELICLPAWVEVKGISIIKSAAVSAELSIGISNGDPGDSVLANRTLGTTYGAIGNNATEYNYAGMTKLRPAADREKNRALSLFANAASGANETATLTILIEAFNFSPALGGVSQ